MLDLIEAFRRSKTMFAGVSLGVFDALADGRRSAGQLGTELKANPDALARMLDACVGLGLLSRTADGYENTPVAQAYLTNQQPPADDGVHPVFERCDVETVVRTGRRGSRGLAPLAAGLRLGRADFLAFLSR